MPVRLLGDDVAIVAYTVREELTVDGKPLTLEAADSSTWVRRDGRWVCALHTEALAATRSAATARLRTRQVRACRQAARRRRAHRPAGHKY